jgi:hypothetical protein
LASVASAVRTGPLSFFALQERLDGVKAHARLLGLEQESLGERLVACRSFQRAALQLFLLFIEHTDDDLFARDRLPFELGGDRYGGRFEIGLADVHAGDREIDEI